MEQSSAETFKFQAGARLPLSLGFGLAMRTTWRINAGIGQNQPFDRLSAQNVGFDDFIYVGDCDSAIPDRIRINHDIRPVLALVQAAGFIGPHPVLQPTLG